MKMIHAGYSQDRSHIAGLAEQVNNNDCLGITGNRFFYFTGIDIIGSRIYIHQHRSQSQQSDHLGSRHIGKCRNNHLIPRLQLQRHQSDLKSIRTVPARNHIGNIQIISQMITKSFHLRTVDKGTAFNNSLHGCIYLLFQAMILTLQVNHLYMSFKHLSYCIPLFIL